MEVVMFNNPKTARDRANGALAQNKANVARRAEWQKGEIDEFPRETCNGKKNRLLRKRKK
jgi:hypothetical protein